VDVCVVFIFTDNEEDLIFGVVNTEMDWLSIGRGRVKTKGAIVTVRKSSGQHPQQGLVVGSGDDVVEVVVGPVVVLVVVGGTVVVVVVSSNVTLIV
jgi:hypothetical protein